MIDSWDLLNEDLIIIKDSSVYVIAMDEDFPQAIAAYFLYYDNNKNYSGVEWMLENNIPITEELSNNVIELILKKY